MSSAARLFRGSSSGRASACRSSRPERLTGCSEVVDAEPDRWLAHGDSVELTVQTLHQREGVTISLLVADVAEEM